MSNDDRASARTKTRARRGSVGRRTLASKADRHVLYERAVQDPVHDAATLAKLYRRFRKEDALVLREDFCGTATLATHWVKARPDRTAVGIDLDAPTLAWGREHNVEPAGPDVARRVELIEGNVLDGLGAKADITCALNFSYCCLKERATMLRYLQVVRRNLRPGGLFIADVLGGRDSMSSAEDVHDHGDFTYRWEQTYFNPLTHEMECHIHFDFADGSKLSPAFSYAWRLWTMPELCDLLADAGFSGIHRLWEKTTEKGEGTGVFYEPRRPDEIENWDQWWTYLVAER